MTPDHDETVVPGEGDPTATAAPASGAADEAGETAPAEVDEFIDAEPATTEEASTDDAAVEGTGADAAAAIAADAGAGSAPVGRGSSRKASLEAEGDVAADFLEGLLDICDIDGDIDVDIDGDRAAVSIVDSEEGRVPRRLVGPDGKVLDALQELTRLAVQSETGERSRLMLDVANHRADRRTEIIEIARGVIAEVKESGEQAEMAAMTAFERKIVHDEVLAAGLRSESDGVEPRRFVVVLPA
ncbi:MAG: R3H domain-containing nucleic acid-binding protein [Actinomycetia bacterium]|nr:R3H domain-containing nucleic acid-binding protein [Actinomycetes bacterium]